MLNAPATGEAMSELILDGAARRASTSRHSRQGACRRLTRRVCAAVQADARHPQVERLFASNRYRRIEGVLTEHGIT
jgi:hypothetical protein